MRVTSIVLAAGLALFANAQTSTGNTTPSQTLDAATAAQSSAQAELIRCLNEDCEPEDVNCRAACLAVPFPSDTQANNTVNCVAACPIGKGTEADNNAYTKCTSDCVSANYYNPSSGTPQPTGGASSGGNNNDDDNNDSNGDNTGNDDATGTDDNEGTQTSDGPSPSQSTGAASVLGASGVVGVFGFVAAIMAL